MAIHSPRKLTSEDFAQLPEDGQRHEILDGAHVVSPSPSWPHQRLARAIFRTLDGFVAGHGLGEVIFAPLDVVLSEHDVLVPDLLFIAANRREILAGANVQGAPDLVVEVLSPSTRRRDLGKKLARYEKLGVPEYWAFDADAASALFYRRVGAGSPFLPPLRLTAETDDRLTTPLLPGLEIALREIFAQ